MVKFIFNFSLYNNIRIYFFQFISIFGYVLIGVILSYILNPIVKKVEALGFSKKHAFSIIITISLIFIITAMTIAIPLINQEVNSLSNKWPEIKSKINNQILTEKINNKNESTYYFPLLNIEIAKSNIDGFLLDYSSQINIFAKNLISVIFKLILIVPIVTYFLIIKRRKIKKKIFQLIPNKYFEIIFAMVKEINKSIENYISAKIIQAVIISVSASIGFIIINLNFPIFLGIFVGLANIIPYIGPLIGAIPAILIAYLFFDTKIIIFVLILLLIVQLIDNFIIQPIILPKLVNEHPIVVIVITLIGAELFGPLGMIMALPIFIIIKIILLKSYIALDFLYSK